MIKSALQSSLTNNVKYRSMAAGVVPSNEYLIQSAFIDNNTTAFIDFDVSALSGVYRHLKLVTVTRSTTTSSGADEVLINFNGQSSPYYTHRLTGTGSSVVSQGWSGGNWISQNPRTNNGASFFVGAEVDILEPFNPNKNTTVRTFFGGRGTAHTTVTVGSVGWFSTAVVTTIRISAEANFFGQGTRLSLYGVTA